MKIESLAISYGCPVLPRSPDLARDDTTSGAVLASVLEDYVFRETIDAVVCLHPTSPFRDSHDIDMACELFEGADRPYAATCSVIDSKTHGNYMGLAGSWSNPRYKMNGAIYIIRADVLLEERKHVPVDPFRILTPLMPKSRSLDIDDATDWAYAEGLMRAQT